MTNSTERTTERTTERSSAVGGEILTRRKKTNDLESDPLYVNPKDVPDGFVVEWKRCSVLGKEDFRNLTNAEQDGWRPADPKMFPSLIGKNHKDKVIYGGDTQDLILMIRPRKLTDEAEAEARQNANQQLQNKMNELSNNKSGEFERTNKDKSMVQVNRHYDRIPVDEK